MNVYTANRIWSTDKLRREKEAIDEFAAYFLAS